MSKHLHYCLFIGHVMYGYPMCRSRDVTCRSRDVMCRSRDLTVTWCDVSVTWCAEHVLLVIFLQAGHHWRKGRGVCCQRYATRGGGRRICGPLLASHHFPVMFVVSPLWTGLTLVTRPTFFSIRPAVVLNARPRGLLINTCNSFLPTGMSLRVKQRVCVKYRLRREQQV